MDFFSRKKRDVFFEVLEEDVKQEYLNREYETENVLRSDALTKDEVLHNISDYDYDNHNVSSSPLEALKKRMLGKEEPPKATATNVKARTFTPSQKHIKNNENTQKNSVLSSAENKETLLERCKPYTLDENGQDLSQNDSQIYKLESVAEILRSDSEAALRELSKKYNLSFEDSQENVNTSINTQKSSTVVKESLDTVLADTDNVFEEKLSVEDTSAKQDAITVISDIDNDSNTKHIDIDSNIDDLGATVRFIPVKDPITNTNTISVSSITRKIDIQSGLVNNETSEQTNFEQTHLESTEFEEFEVEDEFVNQSQAKSILRKLSIKKRNSFLCTLVSIVCSIIPMIYLINPISNSLITSARATLIVCSVFYFINVIANFDMYLSFKKFINKYCSSDVFAALCSIGTITLIIAAIKDKQAGAYHIILLSSLILTIRSLCKFFDCSALLSNFKKIAHTRPKKAVTLIGDSATTFVMAKNAIDGDALIATPRRTGFVNDFMKYSKFGAKLGGKIPTVLIISIVLAVITAISANYYYGTFYDGFYSASVILCIAAFPVIFLIDTLPNFFAAVRLNKKGAMIAGKTAAEKLELANAVVISTEDIFPSGTVTLQSIKVLSKNSIDDTIMRAASLTEAVNSTLAPIFKQIAGTNSSYELPDSDTVKYEDKLGLSGWVADELLFIGNRTLMEAHGIAVPSVELDKKILRKGFFPVYLATGGKACAMIVIQYNVNENIARELKHITELGVTLLITNSDPNINEEMISDYFGIYSDYIKIVSNAGVHMYKNAVIETKNCSAPASFMGSNINFISIMNCASRMKQSNTLLSLLYVILSVIGAVLFIYASFAGTGALPLSKTIFATEIISTIVSIIIFLFRKP